MFTFSIQHSAFSVQRIALSRQQKAAAIFICLVIIFFSAASHTAHAQDAVDLGEIQVRENQERTPSLDSTASATVILPTDQKELNTTVPQMLEESAGVHVKRYGGLDDFSAISLRGSSASQVQIYLDDIPLATSQDEPIDLALVPVEAIKKIEVYRGGSPGIVPDSTAGGVIVLRTKEKTEKPETTLRNMAGSFFTYKGTASRAESIGKFSYIAAYERSQSDGNFKYINNNGTTFNTSDDQLVERQNNDFASNSLYTKLLARPKDKINFSASNVFFNKDQGIPGLGSFESLTARLKTWRDLVSLVYDQDFASVKGLGLHADTFFDFLNSQFSDPDNNIGLGVQENDNSTYRFGTNIRATYQAGSHHRLRGFVAQRSEYFLPVNHAANPPNGPHSSRQTISTGAEDEILLFGERLLLMPSLRFVNLFNSLSNTLSSSPSVVLQKNTRVDHQLSAKMGLKLRLISEFYFKGNFYRGFRSPSFSELFGDRGTIVGNPTLSPEKSLNFDGGLAYHYISDSPKLTFDAEATYFRNNVDDLIQFMQTSQFTIRAQNIGSATIQGLEFALRAAWDDRISAFSSYTFQDAKDTSASPATNGKYVPGRPKNELAAGITWSENWLDWFGTRLSGEIHFMSGNYLDTQNLLMVDRRTLISAGFAAIFVKGITLSFAARNLLNSHISDLVGYPLPGRSYWITVEAKI